MALKTRVAVVGLGSIGSRHARLLLEHPDVEVEVVEPRKERLADSRGTLGNLRNHGSFDAMLASSPEVVWIATPTPLHAEQTIAALQAGAHVFCEKPMTDSVADAIRVTSMAAGCDRVLNIGFYLHFWPGFQAVRTLIRSGALGRILHVNAWLGTYVTLMNSTSRYQASSAGSLFFDYSHQPDLFYWMLGLVPAAVRTTGFQAGGLELTSAPNVAVVVCEYDEPMIATINLNYVQAPDRHHYEIVGDEGWAVVDFNSRSVLVGSRRTQTQEAAAYPMERDDIFRFEQAAFFDAVRGLREPETPAADGVIATAVCAAALESWRTGETVRMPSLSVRTTAPELSRRSRPGTGCDTRSGR
jgi:predicted dehydrogenase